MRARLPDRMVEECFDGSTKGPLVRGSHAPAGRMRPAVRTIATLASMRESLSISPAFGALARPRGTTSAAQVRWMRSPLSTFSDCNKCSKSPREFRPCELRKVATNREFSQLFRHLRPEVPACNSPKVLCHHGHQMHCKGEQQPQLA